MATNLAQTLKGCRSWADLQRRWRPLPKKQKGDLFEELTKHYLCLEPEYASKLKFVWLLREVPVSLAKRLKLPSSDQGIDLVAQTKDGEYWAIQSKYRQESDQSITWREISTFTGLAFGVPVVSNTWPNSVAFQGGVNLPLGVIISAAADKEEERKASNLFF